MLDVGIEKGRIMTTLRRLNPEDLNIIIDTLKEFAQRHLPLDKRLKWDHEDHCPIEEVRMLMSPEVGLHLVFLPEEYGGMGGGAYDIYRVSEEFARIDLGVATAMLAVALGTDPILVGGTPAQKETWISRIASEGLLVAYAVTEPEAGSNVEALKTKATPIPGPDGRPSAYRINGVKQFISNGGIADLYSVLARTPGGPSFFVVEKGTPGLSVGKTEDKHGIRLSNTAQVVLDEVEVPAQNLLGIEEGQGIKQSNEVFAYTRLMVAAFGLGGGESALEKAIAYAKQRKQFGTLLCEKQGYMHKLIVPHAVRLEAARAYIEEVADRLDAGERDIQVEGSIAKLFATETGNATAEAAIQALGGYGYCREYEVEKIKRDVRILPIYEGTSEIQQSIIGLFRLRTNVKRKGAYYDGMADAMDRLDASRPGLNAALAARAARVLGKATILAFKGKIMGEQRTLFAIADSAVEVETSVALCRSAAARGGDKIEAMCRIWAADAASQCCHRLQRLFASSPSIPAENWKDIKTLASDDALLGAYKTYTADMDFIGQELVKD